MNADDFAERTVARLTGAPPPMNEQDRTLMQRFSVRTSFVNGAAVVLYDETADDADIRAIIGCVNRCYSQPKLLHHTFNTYWDAL